MNSNQKAISLAIAIFALVCLMLISSCSALRNVKASISGTVYLDGRPSFGTVVLLDMNGKQVAQQQTNMNGHFRITDIPAGRYQIQYLNNHGIPFGEPSIVEVRLGRPETVDLKLSSKDRKPMV